MISLAKNTLKIAFPPLFLILGLIAQLGEIEKR